MLASSLLTLGLVRRHEVAHTAGDVGYLPQDFAGPKTVQVCDYLRFIAWCRSKRSQPISASHITTALSQVSLLSRQRDKIKTLSDGMVRRLGIAQALLGNSGVLVLDEPTVGLDPVQRQELRELLKCLSDNRSIVVSTHMSEDGAAIASRVIVLDRGMIVFSGPVDDLAALGGNTTVTGFSVESGFLAAINKQADSNEQDLGG